MTEQNTISECNAADREIQSLWSRDADSLGEAADYLKECLVDFAFELDRKAFFAGMPQFRDEFDYFWAFFIRWGAPETWEEDEYCFLGDLSREDLCCAFARSQLDDARILLSKNAPDALAPSLERARTKLRGAKRALDFVNNRMARH